MVLCGQHPGAPMAIFLGTLGASRASRISVVTRQGPQGQPPGSTVASFQRSLWPTYRGRLGPLWSIDRSQEPLWSLSWDLCGQPPAYSMVHLKWSLWPASNGRLCGKPWRAFVTGVSVLSPAVRECPWSGVGQSWPPLPAPSPLPSPGYSLAWGPEDKYDI
jgi:hypothetical protein